MTPYHESDGVVLYHGDCLQVLRTLPAESIDAVVSDPPYGLSFMGKRWDYDVPATEVWAECLRVLKPGGNVYGAPSGGTKADTIGDTGSPARFFYCAKASKRDRGESNKHPTVKPTALMRYLCKLITPPGGLILDPFAGSGSTGRGAVLEGFRFVGMELDAEYVKEAKRRILEVQNGWVDEPEDEPEDEPGQRLLF